MAKSGRALIVNILIGRFLVSHNFYDVRLGAKGMRLTIVRLPTLFLVTVEAGAA